MQDIDTTSTEELRDLHSRAETLKNDTQEFITMARKLSDEGVKDAKKLLDFAKTNWKSILGAAIALSAGGAAVSTVRGKGKTATKKAAGAKATAKRAVKKAKTTAKKAAKKATKKASR